MTAWPPGLGPLTGFTVDLIFDILAQIFTVLLNFHVLVSLAAFKVTGPGIFSWRIDSCSGPCSNHNLLQK